MLRHLHIQNIILIESADIPFGAGLNVISGETGAGKSAVMGALALITGERSDPTMIRKGADKGIVEASFVLEKNPLLDHAGIESDDSNCLTIRREIAISGRSRAFVNDQLITLSHLKTIGNQLLEMVGQHANQELMHLDQHRKIIDAFGTLEADVKAFSDTWQKENQLRAEREQLTQQEAQRLRDREIYQMQHEELQEANLQVGEEETLFAEYTLLTHADELSELMTSLSRMISGEEDSALTLLSRSKQDFQKLLRLDPSLKETEKCFTQALLELQEVAITLDQQLARVEPNAERLAWINERLTLINRLKKKYGPSIQDYQQQLKIKLSQLEGADIRLEELQHELDEARKQSDALAKHLTSKRQAAAKALEKAMVAQLNTLNMAKIRFEISIDAQKRSSSGDDLVEFFFAPNVGERLLSVRECASGGELSRLMLALKAVLADKECVRTLVFDEVDANIGGETATIVGHKLAEIGRSLQLICITHFPQVARYACHHLLISKQERQDRTYTDVRVLQDVDRERELQRMMGGYTNPSG